MSSSTLCDEDANSPFTFAGTGLLTSVTSVVVLATVSIYKSKDGTQSEPDNFLPALQFQAAPHTFIWVGAYVVLAKCKHTTHQQQSWIHHLNPLISILQLSVCCVRLFPQTPGTYCGLNLICLPLCPG